MVLGEVPRVTLGEILEESMSAEDCAVRQISMINDARVWAKLVPKDGDGRSRLLSALNELFPPEDWFAQAANVYGGLLDD